MQHIEFYTKKKNTDLDAMSAAETIRQYFSFPQFKHLTKYGHWKISVDESSLSMKKIKQKLLSESFLICNPNKEETVDNIKLMPNPRHTMLNIQVSHKFLGKKDDITKSLNQAFNIGIFDIYFQTIWCVLLETEDKKKAKELVTTFLLSAKDGRTPLLYNPLFETVVMDV